MEKVDPEKSAVTLGIFAHANAGKTTLTEHLLFHAKIIDTIGRVDEGNTMTDSLKIERERGISVRAALVTFDLEGKKIQLIDTPGHIDFSAEVERALQVLDCAIVVISGVEGVEPQTYTLWKLLKQKKVPTIIFINKMDRRGADYGKTIEDIKRKLEKKVIPLTQIEGSENTFVYSPYTHEQLVELLADLDDEVMEKYLENPDQITQDVFDKRLEELTQKAEVFPVIGGSALKGEGVEDLIGCIKKYLPTPARKDQDKFSAFIYLVRVENGKKGFFAKILSGRVKNRDHVKVENDDTQQVKEMAMVQGNALVPTKEAGSGDIIVIHGLDAMSGQYLGDKPDDASQIRFVNPLISMNVAVKDKSQSMELAKALGVLNEEDPYLNVRHDQYTGQKCISLMGEIQAQIVQTMLRERFHIESELVDPILIHRETPTRLGTGLATYTKVSAVKIEVTPLPPGSGVVYKSKLSTDFLHRKYQRQTERLVRAYMRQGVYGWEITDAEIALVDGRFDSMGSDPMHFNIAVPLALMRALKDSHMKILEPISRFTIAIPKIYMSEVIKALSGFNSAFEVTKDDSEEVTIEGEAKYSHMLNFSNTLIGLTSGRGVYSSYLSRYEVSNNQEIARNYFGPDPRNETVFVINEMGGSLDALDKPFTKRKKESSSKFKRQQKEKLYAQKGKH